VHQNAPRSPDSLKSPANVRGTIRLVPRHLRTLRFLPFAFIVGAEGFVLVAPYLLLFLALVLFIRSRQAREALAVATA
jgi:hypothetical protein